MSAFKLRIRSRYSRREISHILGGSVVAYLPTVNNRVVCACLNRRFNPDAPHIILPGTGPEIERTAELFCRQRGLVPVFIRRDSNPWEYVGKYRVKRSTKSTTSIAKYHRGSETPMDEITRVFFLERVEK